MEIQIRKLKLTKSLVKQFYELKYEMFDDNLDVFGYVKNVEKYVDKLAIVYNCDKKDYFKLNMHWQNRGRYLGYNGAFRGEVVKRVDNVNEWFEKYNKIVNRAEMQGHIYI
jgi:hypothetical protein